MQKLIGIAIASNSVMTLYCNDYSLVPDAGAINAMPGLME